MQDGLIYKGHRVIVQASMRIDMLKQLHSPHIGVDASQRRARETVFFSTVNADIAIYKAKYSVCKAHMPHQ